MSEKINFSGHIYTRPYIISYSISVFVSLVLLGYWYWIKWADLVFQLFTLIGLWQFLCIGLLIFLIFFLIHFFLNKIYGNKVTIEKDNYGVHILQNDYKNNILYEKIQQIQYLKQDWYWKTIRIKDDTWEVYHIEISSWLENTKNIDHPSIHQFINSLSQLYEKKYKYKTNRDEKKVAIKWWYTTIETIKIYDFHFTISEDQKRLNKSRYYLLTWIIIIFIGAWFVIYLIITKNSDDDPGNEVTYRWKPYSSSNFYALDEQVYYNKLWDGYFLLNGANSKTFYPLLAWKEYGIPVWRDWEKIYIENQKIDNIDAQTTLYLWGKYIKDKSHVFYKNNQIFDADRESFSALIHSEGFNTPKFVYAKDKNNVYYRGKVITWANPNTIHSVWETINVVADNMHTYYKGILLTGIDGAKAYAATPDYQLTYITDGITFAVNGKLFPLYVKDDIWWNIKVNLNNITLLQTPNETKKHLMFTDGSGLFYYDWRKEDFIHEITLPNIEYIDNGIFMDKDHIYITIWQQINARKSWYLWEITSIYDTWLDPQYFSLSKEKIIEAIKIIDHNKFKKITTIKTQERYSRQYEDENKL